MKSNQHAHSHAAIGGSNETMCQKQSQLCVRETDYPALNITDPLEQKSKKETLLSHQKHQNNSGNVDGLSFSTFT